MAVGPNYGNCSSDRETCLGLELFDCGADGVGRFSASSEQAAKFFGGQARVADNSAQREGLDRIVTGYSHLMSAIAHDNVLAFTHDAEPRALQSSHGGSVIDARNACHR